MKNLILFVALATFTSCTTIKSSLNEWKQEIKDDIATGNDYTYPNSDAFDRVAYSTDQPKSKIEIDWYQQRMDYWKKYGYSYYIPFDNPSLFYYTPSYIPSFSTPTYSGQTWFR